MVAFSDGVFAVLITILVLELRPPNRYSIDELVALWPMGLSYALSYLFIAIVWINHHHLLRFVTRVTPKLLWANFGHLFSVSLLPFTTEWMADSRLSAWPVVVYAAVFSFINATYLVLYGEVIGRVSNSIVGLAERKNMRRRSYLTLVAFITAMAISRWHPIIGLLVIAACMAVYLKHSDVIGPDLKDRD